MRIIIVGALQTGKTQLHKRLSGKRFCSDYEPTIGLEACQVAQQELFSQIIDTSGAPNDSIRSLFNNNTNVVLLCISQDNAEKNLKFLRSELATLKKTTPPECTYILVETKIDIANKENPNPEISKFIKDNKIQYKAQTSAITGAGINELLTFFNDIAKNINKTLHARPQIEHQTTNNSFLLNAFIATAAVGAVALCITALLVASLPLSIALGATGATLGIAAIGTFFYHNTGARKNEEQPGATIDLTPGEINISL